MSSKVDTVPGPSLTYANQVSFGAITSRREVTVTPKYGGEFKAGSILRMEFPGQDYIDFSNAYMSFKSEIRAGAGNNFRVHTAPSNPNVVTGETILNADSGIPFLGANRQSSGNTNAMKNVKFKPGIQSIFSRIKVIVGSTTIEDIQDYADLYRFMLQSTTSPDWRNKEGAEQEGFYDPEDVQQMIRVINHHTTRQHGAPTYTAITYAAKQHVYTIRPMLGLMALGKLLPVKYMGNLTMEFYMAENADCLWSSVSARSTNLAYAAPAGQTLALRVNAPVSAAHPSVGFYPTPNDPTTAVRFMGSADTTGDFTSRADSDLGKATIDFPNAYYIISDVNFHVPFVTVLPEFDTALVNKIETDGLDLHFSTFHTHVRQVASVGRQNLTFSERSLSVKGGFAVMRNSDDLRDIRSDTTFMANNISWYQWKIGNEYIPAQRVDCADGAARPMAQLKLALGTFGENDIATNIGENDYLPTHVIGSTETQNAAELARCASQPSCFAIGLTLEKSPGQMSGFDSAAASVDIELQMELLNHHTRFSENVYAAGFAHAGNVGNAESWQPSKYKVYTCATGEFIDTTLAAPMLVPENYGAPHAGARVFDTIVTTTAGSFKDGYFEAPGAMMSKSTTCALDRTTVSGNITGVKYQLTSTTGPVFTAVSATGKYARLQFYIHVDSLLRLRRVGQIEVVV